MPYLWTSASEIKAYLDEEDSKDFGRYVEDPESDPEQDDRVMQFENEAVYEVATFLSMAFESSATSEDVDGSVYGLTPLGLKSESSSAQGTVCPRYLRLLVAKYTVAKITMTRFGSSLARLPNWTREFENDVFAQLRRLVINAETAGVPGLRVRSGYDITEILIKMKTRGQAMMETID